MSITKVLTNKDLSVEEKLNSVAETVAMARKAYGNEDEVIESPMIETTHGSMSFVHLEDEGKVEVLRSAVGHIKAQAVEFVTQTPGASMNKKIEELIAVNGLFVNISAGTKFDYI